MLPPYNVAHAGRSEIIEAQRKAIVTMGCGFELQTRTIAREVTHFAIDDA